MAVGCFLNSGTVVLFRHSVRNALLTNIQAEQRTTRQRINWSVPRAGGIVGGQRGRKQLSRHIKHVTISVSVGRSVIPVRSGLLMADAAVWRLVCVDLSVTQVFCYRGDIQNIVATF
jgi:hypothetical protein